MLVLLLKAADDGRFPSVWAQAKLVGILKDDGSRRPLTIFSACYRLWAARHAKMSSRWMAEWLPPGAYGARISTGAPDATWHLMQRPDMARITMVTHCFFSAWI